MPKTFHAFAPLLGPLLNFVPDRDASGFGVTRGEIVSCHSASSVADTGLISTSVDVPVVPVDFFLECMLVEVRGQCPSQKSFGCFLSLAGLAGTDGVGN